MRDNDRIFIYNMVGDKTALEGLTTEEYSILILYYGTFLSFSFKNWLETTMTLDEQRDYLVNMMKPSQEIVDKVDKCIAEAKMNQYKRTKDEFQTKRH